MCIDGVFKGRSWDIVTTSHSHGHVGSSCQTGKDTYGAIDFLDNISKVMITLNPAIQSAVRLCDLMGPRPYGHLSKHH